MKLVEWDLGLIILLWLCAITSFIVVMKFWRQKTDA